MPELPEVRAHAERLTDSHGGAVLERFDVIAFNALKTVAPPATDAVGHGLVAVTTRGKFLRLAFGPVDFVVHLMQGGRITPDPKPTRKPRGGLVRWRFVEHDALLFTEAGTEHRAGVWVVAAGGLTESMEGLGPDADGVGATELGELLRAGGGTRLHGWLRDQRNLAGIGRRLANEICWTAMLSPFAPVKGLTSEQAAAVHGAIGSCIEVSLADERSRDHMARSKDRASAVHHRSGEACPRCGDVIRAVEYNAYTVNYCAACQTGGNVLADNTTSRFLR